MLLLGSLSSCEADTGPEEPAPLPRATPARDGVWISPREVKALPVSGPAWDHLRAAADAPAGRPRIGDTRDRCGIRVLAKALVHARTGEARFREEVVAACREAIGTEEGGTCLALGRNLATFLAGFEAA